MKLRVILLLLLCGLPLAHGDDEDPECRGRCASEYQRCTRACTPPPGAPFDSNKMAACGDRCLKQARSCNHRCAGRE